MTGLPNQRLTLEQPLAEVHFHEKLRFLIVRHFSAVAASSSALQPLSSLPIRRFGDEVLDCLDDVLRTYDGLEEIESLHPRAMPGGREG